MGRKRIYMISLDNMSVFTPALDAFKMSKEKFRHEYDYRRLLLIDIDEICDVLDIKIPELINTDYGRYFTIQIIVGLKKILNRVFSIRNEELHVVVQKYVPKPSRDDTNEDNDPYNKPLGVLFEEIPTIDIAKVFKADKNKKDKNQLEEIEECEEIPMEDGFGIATVGELLFKWNNEDEIPDLYAPSRRTEDKQSVEELVVREVRKMCKAYQGTAADDEESFSHFSQDMYDALSDVTLTPSKRKPENSKDKPETPIKRKRIEDGTSHDTEVLANSYPDDIDFGNFSQDMQQALPQIMETAPKSPLENDKEKAGTSLTQSQVELHDNDWFLPPLEPNDDTVKKHRKLNKEMPLIDEEKQIRLDVSNIYAHTVPMSKRIIDPRKFVVPASQLLSMPSTSHARNTCRLMSRVLLGRFEYATKEVLQKDLVEVGSEIRISEPQSFSSRPKSPSDLRGFVPNDDHALSPMDDLPQNDFSLPTHQLTNNPQEPAIEGDDFTWTKDFIYQSIIQLCQGGVKIQFRDLAPIAETKRGNRVLAFVFILEFVEDEKIYIDQSDETQTIYIWLREN